MENTRDAALRATAVVQPLNGVLDINDIKRILPHRYPFLLVDRIVEFENDKRIVGIKNVTANDEFFNGHFPDNPIMPGVLILEAIAQTGGILMLNKEENLKKSAYFLGLNDVRFRKAVIPGDVLFLEVDILKLKSKIVKLHGCAKVDKETVTECDMTFGVIE